MGARSQMTPQIPSVKLVLLGESSVGKSSIVARYATNTFSDGKEATIGAAFLARICSAGDREVKLEIWDTAGQERFHSLAPMYYRNALAAMVVYDVTKYSSFERAKEWVQELQCHAHTRLVIALVGNKNDIEETLREVPNEEAGLYAVENGLIFVETSARLGTNINHVFIETAKNAPLDLINAHQNASAAKQQVNLSSRKLSSNCAC